MKRFIAVAMSFVLSLSVFLVPASAATATEMAYSTSNEYVIHTSRNAVTVADVDALMGELIEARLTDDTEKEKDILAQFPSYGVESATLQEIEEMVDPDGQIPVTYSDANIDFNTVHSETTVNGEDVAVMRVYATPKSGSEMYHEGTANSNTQPNLRAGVVNAIKTWATFAVTQNEYIGTAASVYDLLKDTISGFTANNVVENLDVDYVYRCIENVVFLYFLDNTTNTWTLMGISTRLGTRVTEIIDTITVDNYAALPGGYTKEFYGDYYDTYYNNVTYCYSHWKYDGPCTRTQIEDFSISGAAGADEAIATVSMVQPYYPANCR